MLAKNHIYLLKDIHEWDRRVAGVVLLGAPQGHGAPGDIPKYPYG